MSAYRELAVVEKEKEREEKDICLVLAGTKVPMGNGYVLQKRHRICRVPGWWSRWLGGIQDKDSWYCGACCTEWIWQYQKWTPVQPP